MFTLDRKSDLKADNSLCQSTKDAKDNDLCMGRLESRSAKTETFAETNLWALHCKASVYVREALSKTRLIYDMVCTGISRFRIKVSCDDGFLRWTASCNKGFSTLAGPRTCLCGKLNHPAHVRKRVTAS